MRYRVSIPYVEACARYEVEAATEDEAARAAIDVFCATCTGIVDGRIRPGEEIGEYVEQDAAAARFIEYVELETFGEPEVRSLAPKSAEQPTE
jgi:hypothetical protein